MNYCGTVSSRTAAECLRHTQDAKRAKVEAITFPTFGGPPGLNLLRLQPMRAKDMNPHTRGTNQIHASPLCKCQQRSHPGGGDDDVNRHIVLQHLGGIYGLIHHLNHTVSGQHRSMMGGCNTCLSKVLQLQCVDCDLVLRDDGEQARKTDVTDTLCTIHGHAPTWQSCTVVTTSVESSTAPIHRSMPYSSSAKPCRAGAGQRPV